MRTAGKWWVLTGVGVASFLACVDLTIVNTATPAIGRDLDASVLQTQLVVNVFFVAAAISVLPIGRICDFFGRRRTLCSGIILFGLFSLGAGYAPDIHFLIACRFFQGIGCAVICVCSSTIVLSAFPEGLRGKAMGALFAINSIGQAMGPLLGGLLVSALSWRWIFLAGVPLACLALAICLFQPGSSYDGNKHGILGWPSIGLFIPGSAGLILGFGLADTFGWGSWQALGVITLGALSVTGFLVVDRRSEHPLVPYRLFVDRNFLKAVGTEFSAGMFITTTLFLVPLYLSIAHHLDDFLIGLLVLPITVSVAMCSLVVGRLTDRVGPQNVLMTGLALFALSALLQSLFRDAGIGQVVILAALMGAGWACLLGPSAIIAVSAVSQDRSGVAIGTTWTFHTMGGSIGLEASMVLLQEVSNRHLEEGLHARGVAPGPWTTLVVNTPQSGEELLERYGGLGRPEAAELLKSSITAGHQAVMLFLAGASLATFLTIMALSRTRSRRPRGRTPLRPLPLTALRVPVSLRGKSAPPR
ncbi:MFS transporter [Amycolatopsis sp. NPDC049868]|uniref:MFS transporter n=1 Tax=Amycolatopsis sp. NPDC049868 TaxID=3363934 RepID=UPI0037B89B51